MSEIKDKPFSWALFFDEVHILSVNGVKKEVRLFENGGAGAGRLIVKNEQSASVASTDNAMDLFSLALRYAVKYDLLIQCATEEAKAALERLGAKDFLDRILTLTNDDERRMRFQGFNFAFANGGNGSKAASPVPVQKRQERNSQQRKGQDEPVK